MSRGSFRRSIANIRLWTALAVLSSVILVPQLGSASHGTSASFYYPFLFPMTGTVTELVDSIVEGKEHDGYDVQGWDENPTVSSKGGRVYASWFGQVTFAGCSGEYGCHVDIDHRNGYKTRYAHLATSTIAVSTNSYVTPMQLIGVEGTTGDSSGVHLHFELLKNGVPMNVNSKIADNQWMAAGSPIWFTNTWILNDGPDATSGPTYNFGSRGDIPIVGDWDCDGYESAGLVRVNKSTGGVQWYFDDDSAWGGGATDGPVSWGGRGDIPIIGDWNGDGCDDPGVKKANSNQWVLGKLTRAGAASTITQYKAYNWANAKHWPIAGAWKTTSASQSCVNPIPKAGVGVTFINASTGAFEWHFDDELNGLTNRSFGWGTRGDHPLVGHWDNACRHGIGIARTNATNGGHDWIINNVTDNQGDLTFQWASASDFSIAIDWDNDYFSEFGIVR
jgi:murein DD-endopeptidase MepM/ murein hydrolase activator NlpD